MSKRIAIIGAGFSGITLGKSLTARGIDYTCYEMSDVIGGNWAFGNRNGRSAAYRSLHIDTSKEKLQFDDFPMPADYPVFPHHTQLFAYLNAVVDHFDLRRRIVFNTAVERAALQADGGWRLTLSNGEQAAFDYLAVANGHHWDPRYPDFPGQFSGNTLHAHAYIDPFDPVDMRGKRVLVVGIGNSAVDIAAELSNRGLASRLVVSTRHGAYVLPKFIFGRPIDQVVETIPGIPLAWQRRLGAAVMRVAVGSMTAYGLPQPDHPFLSAHPTVSSEFAYKVGSGDITVKPNVAALDGDRVRFADGTAEPFDVIIYATGYKISFPFFDPDFLAAPDNVLPLFKRVFKPGIHNLMFIGLAQVLPSIIKFVQVQAEFVAEYLAGTYALPALAEMAGAIERDARQHAGHYVNSPRHTMQVDHNLYAWELRRELARGRVRAARLHPASIRTI